jgi:Na+/H+-dicarboxylate symporter
VAAWVDAVLPSNAVRAAADGAMLPLVTFALLFALALTRVPPASRDAVVRFFRALADAMLVLVGWVLLLAPLGVFAIAMQLVGSIGAAVGAVAWYLALNVGVMVLMMLVLYPVGARAAGVSLRAFAQALLPAQAIAATTRSSIASLPTMLDSARALGVRESTAGFVLPLAVALFRITTPPTCLISTIFAARFHGVELDAGTLVLLVLASAALSAGVVGVPGQASYFVTRLPMFAIAGVPLDLLAPLLAVDVIPDTFRTVGNVTADVAVAALTESSARVPGEAPAVPVPGAGASAEVAAHPAAGLPSEVAAEPR